ncbi:MAG: serine O-acetyltransferase EpsC [Tunicatimonas sp.]
MNQDFLHRLYQAHQECPGCPSPAAVGQVFGDLLGTLFPNFMKMKFTDIEDFTAHTHQLKQQLLQLVHQGTGQPLPTSEAVINQFYALLPEIYEHLQQDADAMFAGDPAAESRSEIIRTYPGFYAIAAYRMGHALHGLGVKTIPRMMTEHAHSRTGIDIHPAARIGSHFFIDHGTGVVIGETTEIGDHVKIYQGVTLGALSVSKEDARKKRHPTIGDRVVIYAGATILGGNTTIGDDSIIGGNVWVTRSVPPRTKVYYQAKMYYEGPDQVDLVVYRDAAS